MEHSIGTRITLEVVESRTDCTECFFAELCPSKEIHCVSKERIDHKNIIYKEIKEEKK